MQKFIRIAENFLKSPKPINLEIMILAVLWILEILIGMLLVLAVLVQVGKGESIGTIFGGGPQAILGPRATTTIIEKGTFILITLFFIITLAIGKVSSRLEFAPTEKLPTAPAPEEVLPQIEKPTQPQQGTTTPESGGSMQQE